MKMDQKVKDVLRKMVKDEPFARKLGIRLVAVEAGHAVVEMESTEDKRNILEMTHGGAIFSLIDEAFEISANSHGTIAVALNMNVTYHHPPEQNSLLRAESREIHRSRKTATYKIEVTDSENKLIASCSALVYRKQQMLPFLADE